ncbi:hypothetical protein M404DRAFT_32730 [Pisolithus tinctorius Marx 270]|uniref:Uncharacterized protein n=1 Tax=Pisolithus tinctorius Marx 270 TaxID=870435 RepID=A0A0C3JHB1_PISTI|nr:hypothetical protein M404DRAFT_32730 [Pisolithus tinctorius Marx 270]
MSANRAPCLSQLVHTATPNPIEAEKTALKVKFIVASVALVAEARCLPDDKEELWEEKGEVYPIIERGQELGIDTKIDAADGPAIAEADEAYERWVAKEIACRKADEDMRMGEEAVQAVGEQGVSVVVPVVTEKMLHVKVVAWLVRKRSQQTIAESEDKGKPKINVPPGSILHKVPCMHCLVRNAACMGPASHTCNGCAWMKQRCKKSAKAMGKRVQAGASVAQASKTMKAGPSNRTVDDDDNKVEVVERYMHVKGKAPAVELQATYLCLQVRVDQLAKALEKIGEGTVYWVAGTVFVYQL